MTGKEQPLYAAYHVPTHAAYNVSENREEVQSIVDKGNIWAPGEWLVAVQLGGGWVPVLAESKDK